MEWGCLARRTGPRLYFALALRYVGQVLEDNGAKVQIILLSHDRVHRVHSCAHLFRSCTEIQ